MGTWRAPDFALRQHDEIVFDAFGALLLLKQGESSLAKMSFGKVLGLIFGCVVVAVLIFMMFVILGNLMHGEQ